MKYAKTIERLHDYAVDAYNANSARYMEEHAEELIQLLCNSGQYDHLVYMLEWFTKQNYKPNVRNDTPASILKYWCANCNEHLMELTT